MMRMTPARMTAKDIPNCSSQVKSERLQNQSWSACFKEMMEWLTLRFWEKGIVVVAKTMEKR